MPICHQKLDFVPVKQRVGGLRRWQMIRRGEQRRVRAFSVLAGLNHTVTAIMTGTPIFPLPSFGFSAWFYFVPSIKSDFTG